jgi:hypothetical protein
VGSTHSPNVILSEVRKIPNCLFISSGMWTFVLHSDRLDIHDFYSFPRIETLL